jgi:Pyruvate/2-oxoacid:ferredoxin oxidoreductase delta subunit
MQQYKSIAVVDSKYHDALSLGQKLGISLVMMGLMIMALFAFGISYASSIITLITSMSFIAFGSLVYTYNSYRGTQPGIKNNFNFTNSLTNKGIWAWILAVLLTGFYCILYWFPQYLGLGKDGNTNTGLVALFDPLSYAMKGKPASEWFVYGALYTFSIILLGIKFIWKYRHNRYHIFRTLSIIFFQTCIAFILPEIMASMNLPYNDFKNIWPLNYYFFFDWHIDELIKAGVFGYFILFWGIISFLVLTPILTYFYGKRWYCSWVCGCGGLAETAGDSFRHLSDKSKSAWRIERYLIYGVLIFAVAMTIAVLVSYFTGFSNLFIINSGTLRSIYGFLIGAVFSGVIGVGFYPIMGSRVWCRFGCPMAAYLGILQKRKSKFRITTNGGQCISCGNCSTYCEMGIDVKSYAQKGEDILRASCVGCGVCSAVCPRGVLRLENGERDI